MKGSYVYMYVAAQSPLECHRRPKVNLGIGMDVGAAKTGGGMDRSGIDFIGWLSSDGGGGGGGGITDVFCS